MAKKKRTVYSASKIYAEPAENKQQRFYSTGKIARRLS